MKNDEINGIIGFETLKMGMNARFETEGLKLNYRFDENETEGLVITEAESGASFVEIPEKIEELAVVKIGKKAFFGSRAVRVILPRSVTEIENWAFAGCRKLEEIWVPDSIESLGKEIFLKTDQLKRIVVYSDQRKSDAGASILLALSVTKMKAYTLFSLSEIGQPDWYERWDATCLEFLLEPDETGFSPILAGGEEDYITNENDIRYYCHKRRMEKAELVYSRLKYSEFLSETQKSYYEQYLRQKNHGEKQDEAWQFLKECTEERADYYRIYADAGCIREDNVDALIQDLDEADTEFRAFIMRYQDKYLKNENIFDKLLSEI